MISIIDASIEALDFDLPISGSVKVRHDEYWVDKMLELRRTYL